MNHTIKLTEYTIDEINRFQGIGESNIEILEKEFDVQIILRGDELIIQNVNENLIKQLESLIISLFNLTTKGLNITSRDVVYTIKMQKEKQLETLAELYNVKVAKTVTGKVIYPKTIGQREYYYALKKNDVVFGLGPAGTGKTYLAVVFAVAALKNNEVKKIILTRPAVEAGESLGFLPGDLKEKVDPYLRPLYDALHDMLGLEQTERLIEKGVIEIAPLAYMRGRTLEDAYVILDEAQNTTDAQMKMFLTRLGFNSKMIVTGDMTQIDLPHGVHSGLKDSQLHFKRG